MSASITASIFFIPCFLIYTGTGMNIVIKIIGISLIAGVAAYFLIPEFRYAILYQLVRIFVPPPAG